MDNKLQEIHQQNAQWEKAAPYNFCDRWCERCAHEKQIRCRLYKDEQEQKITCIAYGREPDDSEIIEEVLEKQYGEADKLLQEYIGENRIDIDDTNETEAEWEEINEHIENVAKDDPLNKTVKHYCDGARAFLEETFFNKKSAFPELVYDFETITWYHVLLPANLYRALCGFYEQAAEDEYALYDAIAQFQVCKKAINESITALRRISLKVPLYRIRIIELLALLNNIHSRIEAMEQNLP